MRTLLSSLAVLGLLVSVASAQVAPYLETFDTAIATTTASCGLASPGTPDNGWTLDATSDNAWRVRTGSTPSSSTGPSADHTGAGGNYLYTEASACTQGFMARIESPIYDASTLTAPAVNFYYHMFGTNQGDLHVEYWDGTAWVIAWSLSGDQGNSWQFASANVMSYAGVSGPEVRLRFRGVMGNGFRSDTAIDDVELADAPQQIWQMNDGLATMDIDGTQSDGFFNAAITNQTWLNCTPPTPATGTLTLTSTVGNAPWNIAFNAVPLVPLGAGATPLPDGQLVNLDFSGGAGLVSPLLGGATPPTALPGQTGYSLVMPYAIAADTDISLQGYIVDASCFGGFCLTQGVELHVAETNVVQGPSSDDGSTLYDVTAAPTCWIPGGLPFYGTTYTQVGVCANGRLLMGGTDTDWSASVAESLLDAPSVGFWSDLDPSGTGSIELTNPSAGVFRVDYVAVPYRLEAGTVTYSIEIDAATGNVTLDGLQGIMDNPLATGAGSGDQQWLGICGGAPQTATDPGVTAFAPAGGGSVALLTDCWYDFNDPSLSGVGGLPSLLSGINTLQFIPNSGNYDWVGL